MAIDAIPLDGADEAPRGRRTILIGAAAGLGLLALAAIAGSGTPAAAPADAPADVPAAAEAPAAAFGTATPTEKFVQSFQQQVTQQLQSALSQAGQEQDARLHRFELEQQQRAREQNEALQRALDAAVTSRAPAAQDADPPRVNVRHARESEPSAAGVAALADLAPEAAPPPPAESYPREAAVPPERNGRTRPRPGDANVAPHGFIEGRLLNGVVAVVGGPDRESVVALSGRYQSANGFVSDLDGCFALVQGRPELAAGRIDFKLSRLTCNFPDGASRTWDTAGWVVDADGIRGVRATIVQSADRKAAVAAAGGALAGVGQHLSQQQYQVRAGPTVSSSSFVGSPGADAAGGAAAGAANALGQSIADYYNLYAPSLQVGGGTQVTVVLANELKLPASGREASQTRAAVP